MIATNFATLGILSLIPLIRRDIAMSGTEIGVVAGAPSFTGAICVYSASRMIDRIGARAAVAMAQGVVVVATMLVALAANLGVCVAGAALLGLAYGILNPATNLLAISNVRRRGLAMGIKQTGVTVGGVAAGISLPALATVTGWRVALVLPVGLALVVGIWASHTRFSGSRGPLLLSVSPIRIRRMQIAVYGLVMAGIQSAIFGYAAIYLVAREHFSPRLAGDGFATVLAAAGVGRIAWGAVSDQTAHRQRILISVAVCATICLALVPFVAGALIWATLAAVGISAAGWNGAFQAVVAESAGSRGVARASAFALFFIYSGSVAFPPVLGTVVDRLTWTYFWEASAALTGIMIAVWVIGGRGISETPRCSQPVGATLR